MARTAPVLSHDTEKLAQHSGSVNEITGRTAPSDARPAALAPTGIPRFRKALAPPFASARSRTKRLRRHLVRCRTCSGSHRHSRPKGPGRHRGLHDGAPEGLGATSPRVPQVEREPDPQLVLAEIPHRIVE